MTIEGARETLYRYALAVDRRDEELLAACLTEDVVLERADGAREGREAVLAFYRTVFAGPTGWSKHLVTNVLATPAGHGFEVTAYFQAVSRTETTGVMIFGRYADLLVPGGDGMRIRRKSIDVQQSFPLEVNA